MDSKIQNLIQKEETKKRVALTKKYPSLLLPILETKRLLNNIHLYSFKKYHLKKIKNKTQQYNIVEHSSPLYRKYNEKVLDDGKIENIKIAIQKLDGLVIYPGQIFSFWKHVGRSSKGRGFKKGLVISNGELLSDYGGGLCQLSNLIAYMFASTECDFMERKHHSRDVFPDSGRTIPFASGATVFYNLIDLKVKNTYDFPITLNLRTTKTQLKGSISSSKYLDFKIKLKEHNSGFYKSRKTNLTYRYNQLWRVFYKKTTKEKIKEELLWENFALVTYDSALIKREITQIF